MKKALIVILMLFVTCAHAQKWITGETNEKTSAFAGTTNDSGGILAQYCDYSDANCYWTMSSGTTNCDDQESYPAMVSSDAGALHVNMYCYKAGGRSRMAFKNFDEIDSIIRKGKNIAIVIPLDNGNFRVSRFDLNGSVPVINAMRESAVRKSNISTKDKIL